MIPLIVALWEHADFGGRKRGLIEDTPDLSLQVFNNKATAVGVHPGPDYAAWKAANGGKEPTVGLYENANYGGAVLVLTAGAYSNLGLVYSFNDQVSSVRFNPAPPSANPIGPIPLIVELYQHESFKGNRLVMVEDSADLARDFGEEFQDKVTSVRVRKGPNFVAGKKARLFRDVNFAKLGPELAPGDYPNIGSSHGFNDVLSSIQVR